MSSINLFSKDVAGAPVSKPLGLGLNSVQSPAGGPSRAPQGSSPPNPLAEPTPDASADYSSQLSGDDWVRSILSQMPQSSSPAQPPTEASNIPVSESASITSSGSTAATVSESNSDEITQSLSLFLSQHVSGDHSGITTPQPLLAPAAAPASKGMNATTLGAHGGNSNYNPTLTSMLDIGYDNGGRRVISMPNPLGNLSFEIPINPPVQPSAMAVPLVGHSYLNNKGPHMYSMGPAQQFPFAGSEKVGTPVHHLPLASSTLLGSTSAVEGLFGLTSEPPSSMGAPPGLVPAHSSSSSSIDGSAARMTAEWDEPLLTDQSSPEQPISQQLQPPLPTAAVTKTKASTTGRPPLPGRSCKSQCQTATASPCVNNEGLINSTASTPLLNSTTTNQVVSHRVDRQLAAAGTRPLLFVRPTTKASQSRRRKRRCISSTDFLASSTAATDNHLPLGELQSNQWQRISEQRRRDAMRENFDLLKRMLPQEYMDSDDGRELARPVLLSRFLRWVDDTLIEMENLKTEVARLRMAAVSGAGPSVATTPWSQSPSMVPSATLPSARSPF